MDVCKLDLKNDKLKFLKIYEGKSNRASRIVRTRRASMSLKIYEGEVLVDKSLTCSRINLMLTKPVDHFLVGCLGDRTLDVTVTPSCST